MTPIVGLGARILAARQSRNVKQVELAAACRISRNFLSYIENDLRVPAADVLRDIAVALAVTTDALLGLPAEPDGGRAMPVRTVVIKMVRPKRDRKPVSSRSDRIGLIRNAVQQRSRG